MRGILEGLNEAQARAVRHPGGPILVVAGPGTGKTRTLTRRVAYLVKGKGADPGCILAVTFTHRAAREMKERLADLLGAAARPVFVGTFHALGLEMLREDGRLLGFDREPILYDEEEQKALMGQALRSIKPRDRGLPVEQILFRLDAALNRGASPSGEEGGFDLESVHHVYNEMKRSDGAVDFNDLLLLPLKLLNRFPERLEHYRRRFRHLFVDEYQDVNAVQVDFIRLLGEGAESVMAIGDPDQAIYAFRGSDVENFLAFPETFPGAEILHLSSNYRSSVTIVNASEQLIRRNRSRLEATPVSEAVEDKGLLLDLRVLASDRDEAVFVSRRIEELAGGLAGYGLDNRPGIDAAEEAEFAFGDMAVLYRLNTQARAVETALDRSGIPFQRVGVNRGGLDLHERAVLAAARLRLNPSSGSAWRVLDALAGGRKSIRKEAAFYLCDEVREPRSVLLEAGAALAKLLPALSDALLDAVSRLEERTRELELDPIAYLTGAPLVHREDPFDTRCEKVTLSTLHASKGLEFPVVFIVGLEEGILPYLRGDESDREAALEEERRLLYVGMTRARKQLYLTRSRRRTLFGKQLEGRPSPFLSEISEDLVRFVREKTRVKRKGGSKKEGGGQQTLF